MYPPSNLDAWIFRRTWISSLGPTVIYVDNTTAITLSEKFNLSNNSAHLVTKLNYIHQEIINGNVKLQFINNTENQIADILTKLLPIPQFLKLEEILLHGHNKVLPRTIDKEAAEKHLLKKKYKYKKKTVLSPEEAISGSSSSDDSECDSIHTISISKTKPIPNSNFNPNSNPKPIIPTK